MAAFDDLGVLPELVNALNDLEWTHPTDIQYEAIPAILGGGYVCMAAETGSGKTGAFCISILQIVYELMQPKPSQNNKHNQRENRRPNQPMCLIIEPTKELAQQTHAQIERFGAYLNNPKIKNVIAVGGVNMGEQLASIENGSDILTATPERICSLVQEGRVDLGQVRFFVLDEADSLLGGQNDSAKIVHQLHNQIPICGPSGQRLQMIVCSATLHNIAVQKLATQYMHFLQWIDLKGQDGVPETVRQVICLVDPKEDKSWIRLRSQPGNSVQTDNIHLEQEERAVMPSGMPPDQCSPTLQRKFENFFERKSSGWDPNLMIKRRKDYKNPSCLETLVNLYGIDEKGTNFPTEVFDPNEFWSDDFYDALGDHQQSAMEEAKRRKQQQMPF